MSQWKDVTTYKRGDIGDDDRKPRSWELKAGAFRLVVTRQHGADQNTWYFNCEPFFNWRPLASPHIDDAMCQAKALLQVELERAIKELLAGGE